MSDATSSPRLAAKLASMIGAVSGVEKRGWNPIHKYHYVTAIDVYEATRDLMAKHNVILLQRALLDRVERVDRPTKYGGTMTNIRMGWEFVWVCGDTGETISVPWLSEAEDGQDKGPNKAATAARKYFLISQLQIPVDQIAQEDADAGHQAPAQVAPQQKPNNARRQAPAQQAPQQERRVAQNGTTREAPPTAYREDNGRAALRRRAWDVLVDYYADGAPPNQAKAVVRTGLLALAEDHPDMLPIVNGEPSLQTASNDQLQRLIGYVESIQPGEDVPF
jgi:hypothetical protein